MRLRTQRRALALAASLFTLTLAVGCTSTPPDVGGVEEGEETWESSEIDLGQQQWEQGHRRQLKQIREKKTDPVTHRCQLASRGGAFDGIAFFYSSYYA